MKRLQKTTATRTVVRKRRSSEIFDSPERAAWWLLFEYSKPFPEYAEFDGPRTQEVEFYRARKRDLALFKTKRGFELIEDIHHSLSSGRLRRLNTDSLRKWVRDKARSAAWKSRWRTVLDPAVIEDIPQSSDLDSSVDAVVELLVRRHKSESAIIQKASRIRSWRENRDEKLYRDYCDQSQRLSLSIKDWAIDVKRRRPHLARKKRRENKTLSLTFLRSIPLRFR